MSINQLIATQYQRTRPDSPLQQLAAVDALKAQQAQNQAAGEQSKYALAGMGRAQEMEGLKFAANIKNQIDTIQDPVKKAEVYQTALDMARRVGHDVQAWPQQYDDRADMMLGMARAQTINTESGDPAEIKAFKYLLEALGGSLNPDGSLNTDGMTPQEAARARAAAVKLGLTAKATGSSALTIAEQGKTNLVGQSQAQIDAMRTAAAEGSKLDVRSEKMPGIIAAETTSKLEAEKEFNRRLAETQAKSDLSVVELGFNYLEGKNLDAIYGGGEWMVWDKIRSPEGKTMRLYIEQIAAGLEVAARTKVAGQGTISDDEAKQLAKTATLLREYSLDPKEAQKQLDLAKTIYQDAAKKSEKNPPEELAAPKQTETQYFIDPETGTTYKLIPGKDPSKPESYEAVE